jgi:acetone carboxylase gamma subunit
MKIRITEALNLDLANEVWCCSHCGCGLIGARENYKKGCKVRERMPEEIHQPLIEGAPFSFAPDSDWCRVIEFYCPRCGLMIENQYLPPGHPITHDIELDIDDMKERYKAKSQANGLGTI